MPTKRPQSPSSPESATTALRLLQRKSPKTLRNNPALSVSCDVPGPNPKFHFPEFRRNVEAQRQVGIPWAYADHMKENKKIACSRRAVALLAAALLAAAALWASVSRIAAAMTAAAGQYRDDNLPPWTEGLLDIHHLQVGASQSTFIVMPDGSTMLIDAGDLATKKPGKCVARDPIPNSTRTTAGWISEYIRTLWPHDLKAKRPTLDFVLVTHFRKDHIGDVEAAVDRGTMSLHEHDEVPVTGLAEVAEAFNFAKLIDRAYPDYNFPVSLFNTPDGAFYIGFAESMKVRGTSVERFEVASSKQMHMVKKEGAAKDFVIKNIKANTEVAETDSDGNLIGNRTMPGTVLMDDGNWDENMLSTAIVIEYGSFRYYEGGDTKIGALDMVNPTAEAVGSVDVATLNHHGHGVSELFARLLDPKVAILQAWCSDHPPSQSIRILSEVGLRMEREIFATDLFAERSQELRSLGLDGNFRSTGGHVVVRVYPQHGKQTYEVFVLDPGSLPPGRVLLRAKHAPSAKKSNDDDLVVGSGL